MTHDTQTLTMENRYPLFAAVDQSTWDIKGPFKDRDAADRAADSQRDGVVVYCRQLRPSEVLPPWEAVAYCKTAREIANEVDLNVAHLIEALPVWGSFDEMMVFVDGDDGSLPTESTFAEWADTHLRAELYINEGDE